MSISIAARCFIGVSVAMLITVIINFQVDTTIQASMESNAENASFELLHSLETEDITQWPDILRQFESKSSNYATLYPRVNDQGESELRLDEYPQLSQWTGEGDDLYFSYDEEDFFNSLEWGYEIEGTLWEIYIGTDYSFWYFLGRIVTGLSLAILTYIALRIALSPTVKEQQSIRKQLTRINKLPANLGNLAQSVAEETLDLRGREVLVQEQWRDLLHAIAHELRSPLSRINFAVSEIINSETVEEKLELEKVIDNATDEINELVSEVLRYSRLELAINKTEFEEVEITQLINQIYPRIEQIYKGIDFQVLGDEITVSANQKQLERAVINLIRNAARYSSSIVRIHWTVSDHSLIIAIEDDGPGVAPGKRERIFEPFTRLDPSRSRDSGGVGLGLAIVKAVVDNHHGTVSIRDSELGGACFQIEIPLNLSASQPIESSSSVHSSTNS